MNFLIPILKPLLRLVIGWLYKVETSHLERAEGHAKTLIVANHISFLDGLLLALYLPGNPVFAVYSGLLKKRRFRFLLSFADYFPLDPSSPFAIKSLAKVIDSGRPVVIFPEGRITTSGSLMKIYDGSAFLAAKTGAALVAARITGPERTPFAKLSKDHPKKLFPASKIALAEAVFLPMPAGEKASDRRRRAGEALRRIMQESLLEERPTQTIFEALLDASERHGPQKIVLESLSLAKEIESRSYKDMIQGAMGLRILINPITQERENVGVLLPNSAACLLTLYALSAGNRVPAMLNFTAGAAGLNSAISTAQIKTVISSKAFIEQAKLTPIISQLQARIVYLEDLKETMSFGKKILTLIHSQCPRWVMNEQKPETMAAILFTSGSEGVPKGVAHSHNSILANAYQARAAADFSPTDHFMMALPLFHSFGFTCGAVLPFMLGAKAFLYPSPLHYRVIPEIVYDRGCTILFGTNAFLANYAKKAHPYDFRLLRYVVAGAEKLAESTRQTWNDKFGIRIFEGYGATETAPIIAVNTPMAYRRGSVGELLPGMRAAFEEVPGIEGAGRLHVTGPNVMLGYILSTAPGVIQPAQSSMGPGWHDTGDIVALDDDHFLTIKGRMKRFAKIAGEMVSLESVEKMAAHAKPSAAHAAASRPDSSKGEALVLLTTDTTLSREDLVKAAKALGYPELYVPRIIHTVEAIPMLGSGKTDYAKLTEIALTA